jgi:hypothetical protein
VPAAPSYDAWSWLLWGREVAHGSLSTADGPAFKPLPVVVCALLSPLGPAAPTVWVLLARAGALAAIGFAGVLVRGRAGWLAALGVALTGGYLSLAVEGNSEGLFLALALAGVVLALEGRSRWAVACFVCCALLRVEAWPFLVALALWQGWRWRLVLASVGVLAAWFVPEWLASGELLRSASRAQVPNPGQPALADVPALASLGDAFALLFLPVVVGALFAWRWALAGVAWIAVVALMAQVGFSGEWRYAVPGAAALAIAGAVGLAARPRLAIALAVPVLVVGVVRAADLPGLRDREVARAELASDLRRAVADGGGADALLRCGRPYVGRYRGPLLAYALRVEKRRVDADGLPSRRGVVFRSLTEADTAPAPAAPTHFRPVASEGRWTVLSTCEG